MLINSDCFLSQNAPDLISESIFPGGMPPDPLELAYFAASFASQKCNRYVAQNCLYPLYIASIHILYSKLVLVSVRMTLPLKISGSTSATSITTQYTSCVHTYACVIMASIHIHIPTLSSQALCQNFTFMYVLSCNYQWQLHI